MKILFKVVKNGRVSFLYGTISSGEDKACRLSAEAKQAFEQSRYLLIENDSSNTEECQSALPFKVKKWKSKNAIGPLESYADYLNASQIKKIGELLELRSSVDLFNRIENPPMLLCHFIYQKVGSSLLSNLRLDSQLILQANFVEKSVISLDIPEDLAERIIGFSFDYNDQISYAMDFLKKYLNENFIKTYMTNCREFNWSQTNQEFLKPFASLNNEIATQYESTLVEERNIIFVEKMKPYLKKGDAFIAIGVAHLEGVISLLQSQNYEVEPVQEQERLYKIQELKNTNISLLKRNLLESVNYHQQALLFFSDYSQKKTFVLQKRNLLIFWELIKEGKIDKNIKFQINVAGFDEEDWSIVSSIHQEVEAPEVSLTAIDTSSDRNEPLDDLINIIGELESYASTLLPE